MKVYDIITWLISCNIMGSFAALVFPYALGSYSGADLYSTLSVAVFLGILAGLSAGAVLSRLSPSAEKVPLYAFFGGSMVALWVSLTGVINSIQDAINYTGFPIASMLLGIGMLLFTFALFRFGGAELES